ncbi:hypothetical protein ABPG73_006204 [Tetrahymena malaccensis]
MSELNYLLQSSLYYDSRVFLNSIIVSSSQFKPNNAQIDQIEFQTCFKPQEMLMQIQEKSIEFYIAKDKDAILFLGSTGSGKSTSINFLLRKKMIQKLTSYTRYIEDVGEIEAEEEKISTEDNEDDGNEFKIGFKKESQTLVLKAKQLQERDFFICDTPGFQDSRGFEVELSNSICLINFIKQCRSICPILTINYADLISVRGESFKDVIAPLSKFIATTSMDKILYFYTHVPESINTKRLVKEIIDIKESLGQNSSPELKILFSSLLKSFNNNRAFILNPLQDDPGIYLKTIQDLYDNNQFIDNPQNQFSINLSEDTLTKLKLYSEDVFQYIIKQTKQGFMIEYLIDVLNQYLEIKDILKLEFMQEKYDQCREHILNYANRTKDIAFKDLNQSKNQLSEINQRYLNQIRTCLYQTKKLEQYNDPHFLKYETSYELIINQIKLVIQELCDEIKSIFDNQIEQASIQQLKFNIIKIQQLSNLSPQIENISQQTKQFVNQQLSNYGKEQIQFLEDALTTESEAVVLKEKLSKIVSTFKILSDIDTQLYVLINFGEESFLNNYQKKINSILSDQNENLNQNIKKLREQMKNEQTPDQINFELISSNQQIFEIRILLELNENKFLAQKINNCSEHYNKFKENIEQLSQDIVEYLNEYCQKKKYLTKYQVIIDALTMIIGIDQNIKSQTESYYIKIVQSIKNRIFQTKTQIKYEIKLIINNEIADKNLFQPHKMLAKSMVKIQKYSQFLKEVQWIDEKLKTKCVQQTQESMKKWCQQIMKIIGTGSIQDIIQSISNHFYKLQNQYQDMINYQMNQDSNYLKDVTEQYEILQDFVSTFSNLDSLSFMKNQLISIQNSKQIIKITVENLQKQIKLYRFAQVKKFIQQLNQLSDNYSQNQLQECKQQLEQYQSDLLQEINNLVNYNKNNFNINLKLFQKLECLQEISRIIEKYKIEELDQIFEKHIVAKIQFIEKNIQNLQFDVVYTQYSQLEQLIKEIKQNYSEVSYLFFKEEFECENIISKIQKQIDELNQFYKQKSLFKLIQKLHSYILEAYSDDPFIEFYKNSLVVNLYSIEQYTDSELNEISQELLNNDKEQAFFKKISLRLNQLEQFSLKFQQFVTEQLSSNFEECKSSLELFTEQLAESIQKKMEELEKIQKKSNQIYNFKIFESYENFEETSQRLKYLQKKNIQQYNQEMEDIEKRTLYQLDDLISSFQNMDQELRLLQIKQIMDYLKYQSHFSSKSLQKLQNFQLDLENKLKKFLNQPNEDLQKIEQSFMLLSYHDLIQLIKQLSQNIEQTTLLEEQYLQKLNNFFNFLFELEKKQQQLIEKQNQNQCLTNLKRIYEFILSKNDIINLYKKQKKQFQIGGETVNLNFLDLPQIEDHIQKNIIFIREQIEVNFLNGNYSKLKQNLQILEENQDLNQLMKKILFDYEEELQKIQLKVKNLTSDIIQYISEKYMENAFLGINLLFDFQEEFKSTQGLDVSEFLINIQKELEYFLIEVQQDNNNLNKEFILLIQQCSKLHGKAKEIIIPIIEENLAQKL